MRSPENKIAGAKKDGLWLVKEFMFSKLFKLKLSRRLWWVELLCTSVCVAAGLLDVKKWSDRSTFIAIISGRADITHGYYMMRLLVGGENLPLRTTSIG
jgi:hypothetical protein